MKLCFCQSGRSFVLDSSERPLWIIYRSLSISQSAPSTFVGRRFRFHFRCDDIFCQSFRPFPSSTTLLQRCFGIYDGWIVPSGQQFCFVCYHVSLHYSLPLVVWKEFVGCIFGPFLYWGLFILDSSHALDFLVSVTALVFLVFCLHFKSILSFTFRFVRWKLCILLILVYVRYTRTTIALVLTQAVVVWGYLNLSYDMCCWSKRLYVQLNSIESDRWFNFMYLQSLQFALQFPLQFW